MKKILLMLILAFSVFVLASCSAVSEPIDNPDTGNIEESSDLETTSPDRKLIYTVDIRVFTEDMDELVKKIKQSMNNDEWFDKESTSLQHYELVIRIKTTRLDAFLNSISTGNKVTYFEKTAEDISKQYVNLEAQILNLELQLDRLQALYQNASLSDMIIINERMSKIESELSRLKGNLSNFDSLVEYSTISLVITTNPKEVEEENFFTQVKDAFMQGFDVLVQVIRFFIKSAAFLIPSGFVLAIALLGITQINRVSKRKKQSNKEKKEDKDKK